MEPALKHRVNNEIETRFFIDAVYSISPQYYAECLKELEPYLKYFPSIEQLDSLKGNIGDFVVRSVQLAFPGSDVRPRRQVFYSIKMEFKKKYFIHCGFPKFSEDDEVFPGPDKFKERHLETFRNRVVQLNDKQLVSVYIFHTLRSNLIDIKWLDYKHAQTEMQFIDRTISLLNIPLSSDGITAEKCINAVCEFKSKITVIENAPWLEKSPRLLKTLCDSFESRPGSEDQCIILSAERTDVEQPIAVPAISHKSGKKKRISGRVSIYVGLAFILFFLGFLLGNGIYGDNGKPTPVFSIKFFSDEIQQDDFNEGVLFSWYNKKGKVISTERTDYKSEYAPEQIPSTASFVVLSKGSYEIYPDTLQVETLNTQRIETLVYREIRIGDEVAGEIQSHGAQRWYCFYLSQPARISVVCTALEKRLSPQTAVFADRLGKDRRITSTNVTGTQEADNIAGILQPGKYYLKVRGFDNTVGLFKLKVSIKI